MPETHKQTLRRVSPAALKRDRESVLARKLARAVFNAGDAGKGRDRCGRIQFMCGKWPNKERGNGGLCEQALASLLAVALRENR